MIPEIKDFTSRIKTTLYKDVVLKVNTDFINCNSNDKITKNAGEAVYVIKKLYPDGREYYYAITKHQGHWYYNNRMKTRYGIWYNNKVKITEEEINQLIGQ